ncbi:Uncharacterised protein [Salmonella enterica subsp. enterica serovar Bovismorbificans]|uniref:Uncharacterized protein n=1 Tax=Salmonella enterica subsp. enterica serovar Bovismorbificans TaxID=58097 RepID=A0A655E1J7_SALET|nr:Uncharacterised protein [Salmonella enterica subsp. enterica serovar Bovismorbificans]CNU96329.1 Uncharacterised protein [Salmonella enterica subsp. enterica serovar Bovismorbificans]
MVSSHRSSEISRQAHSGRPDIQLPLSATMHWPEHLRARARYVWGLILYLYLYLS